MFSAHLTVLRLLTTVWEKTLKNLLSPWVKCTSIKNRVLSSLDRFTVFTTVWAKTSKISYLCEFSAQVSQIVFSAHLTVLRFITTVWGKTSKISFLREFSAQSITNRVLSSFDRFTVFYNCMRWNFKNLISPWVQCTSITNPVLSYIWPFYGFLQLNEVKLKKSHMSMSSVSQIVFWTHLKVWRPSTKVWGKTSKISYLREFSAQVS